jgi:hypothetical protein
MFNFFKSKNTEKESIDDNLLEIKFSLDTNNTVYIKADWANNSADLSQMFGQLLFGLNNGVFAEKIINLLLNDDNQSKENKEFLNNTLLSWKELNDISIQSAKHSPLIKPSQFNTYVRKS